MENKNDEIIYQEILSAQVSQNCEAAFEDYCVMIVPICPIRQNIAHSLLRIAIRPLFYLGYFDSQYIIEIFKSREIAGIFDRKNMNGDYNQFIIWIMEHSGLVDLCVKELKLCCLFYDLYYDEIKNKVIFDRECEKSMEMAFSGVLENKIYKEFSSFEEFKYFFTFLFCENGIILNHEEIDRIIMEEEIKIKYFDKIIHKH